MPDIETIVKGMPTDVQVMVKVPHYVVGEHHIGRVFWQKMKVSKELITPMVNLLEDGVDKAKIAKATLVAEMRELQEKDEELEKENKRLHDQLNVIEEQVNKMREANSQYFKDLSAS